MSLFGTSSGSTESAPASNPPTQSQTAAPADKPKPCCVCKTEKATRDDCMLFSKTEDPTQECKSTIDQYKSCMAGFGFKV
ncbi:copper metallochaperone COX17 [Aspergillus candidus]|uniref:Cytochrome C oxidase copper chaperone-domain-containing protein n=1 Tax=Aspergillus candidus TaxID=41067 RepID=A0A2I2FCG5_ASPCN|nr:cytochrome C oxidase copper chaperone-domain-containing protein [Aspergillus candidus]PLB38287.1 cytochrome C oxidase copper chaperone-domain-containing protein [Aspergillus candidus]